jgi:hypothetical protein
MASNGMSIADLLHRGRYHTRWITDYSHKDGLKILGWCIYDSQEGKVVFEHSDKHKVDSMFKLLKDEDNNVRRT